MMNELQEIYDRQKKLGLDNPMAYKAKLVGCSSRLLEIEKEYLDTQLFSCFPSEEESFKAKLVIVEDILANRGLK